VLQDPAILLENVYNIDETGVMLCILGSVKVLLSKDNPRDYRGAGVKRTIVTAIECISANGRSLLPIIIWPATTHRSNWTTFPTRLRSLPLDSTIRAPNLGIPTLRSA
jgi:hypothetical protein